MLQYERLLLLIARSLEGFNPQLNSLDTEHAFVAPYTPNKTGCLYGVAAERSQKLVALRLEHIYGLSDGTFSSIRNLFLGPLVLLAFVNTSDGICLFASW